MVWFVAVLVFVLDRLSKHAITAALHPGESRLVVHHFVYWTYVRNVHGAFGMIGASTWTLIALSLGVLLIFWIAFRDLARRSLLARLGLGAIVGGTVGNVVDRLQHRYVIDFIDLRWWPVFNVADACITLGILSLLLASITVASPRRRAAMAAGSARAGRRRPGARRA